MKPRYVRQEVIDALGPVERLIAQEYFKTGRWVLIDNVPGKETPTRDHRSNRNEGGYD